MITMAKSRKERKYACVHCGTKLTVQRRWPHRGEQHRCAELVAWEKRTAEEQEKHRLWQAQQDAIQRQQEKARADRLAAELAADKRPRWMRDHVVDPLYLESKGWEVPYGTMPTRDLPWPKHRAPQDIALDVGVPEAETHRVVGSALPAWKQDMLRVVGIGDRTRIRATTATITYEVKGNEIEITARGDNGAECKRAVPRK